MAKTIIIKKYPNRRLYNTEESNYVSVNQVADLIKQGLQVKVIDAKTNEDVTAFILTQIILEEARAKNVLLPVPLLYLIIRYGDNVLSEFFEKYLQQTIENYLTYKHSMDEQFRRWLEMSMDLSAATQKTMAELSPFKPFLDLFADAAKRNDDTKE
jgi:polyhydroxyalkanoate synthesis repressor PhaR